MRPLSPLVLCLAIAATPVAFAQTAAPAAAPDPAAESHAHGDRADRCMEMHDEMHGDAGAMKDGDHCAEMHAGMHGEASGDHAAHAGTAAPGTAPASTAPVSTAPADTAAAPVDHAAHHAATPAAPAAAPDGQAAHAPRFATDAVLREQMAGIRTAVGELAHHEMGHMGADQARVFAADIETRVQKIIAECKLPPDADAALHTIIVPLLNAALALKAEPADASPVATMRTALADYARRFDDPGTASGE